MRKVLENEKNIEVLENYTEEKIKTIFEPLEKYKVDDFNIFTVLGLTRMEIRHSNVLAYLLNPTENHGLGSQFLNLFLNFLKEKDFMEEVEHYTVTREELNMDITLENKETKKRIVIENKIDSVDYEASENDKGQLEKYRTKIKDNYSNENVVYIYLTPYGDNPIEEEERKYWKNLSYKDIFLLLKQLNLETVSQKVIDFIEDYKKIIEVYIMKNEELERICTEIYNNNREFFELVMTNKKDYVLEIIEEFLKEKENQQIIKCIASPRNNYKRFITSSLKEYSEKSKLKENALFYEIEVTKSIDIYYCFNRKIEENYSTEDMKEVLQGYNYCPNKTFNFDEKTGWISLGSLSRENKLTLDTEEDKDKIKNFLEKNIQELKCVK